MGKDGIQSAGRRPPRERGRKVPPGRGTDATTDAEGPGVLTKPESPGGVSFRDGRRFKEKQIYLDFGHKILLPGAG